MKPYLKGSLNKALALETKRGVSLMERLNKKEDKQETLSLRSFYKTKIKNLSDQSKKEKSHKINQLIWQLPFLKEKSQDSYIAFYRASKQEPCLLETYSQFKEKACFPVTQGDQLAFYSNPEDQWEKGPFQIEEPLKIEKNKVPLQDISLFFIPGTCFDHQGFRFGKGLGYYDKSLASIPNPDVYNSFEKQTLLIGVSFFEQVQNSPLPVQSHDIRLHFLVTDQFILCPLNKIKTTQTTKEFR